MGWLGSLFNKKKEIETANVELNELSSWFDQKTEPLIDNLEDDINEKLKEIKIQCQKTREHSKVLMNAKLMNEKIPERAMVIMNGNREAYLRSVNLFIDQIKTPSIINIRTISDFLSRFEANLDNFTKTSAKSYYVLQEFFKRESGEVAECIKRIDALSRSLLGSGYKDIDVIGKQIAEIDTMLDMKRKARELLQSEEAEYNSTNAAYKAAEEGLDKIKQTRDYKDFLEIEREKERVSKEMKRNDEEFSSMLSPVSKSMKKFSKMAVEDEDLINKYIESPIEGLLKDHDLKIIGIFSKIKEETEKGTLDLQDKKKEKTIEAINSISKDKLVEISSKHHALKEEMEKLKKREGINTSAQKLSELNYKLSHLNNQLKRSLDNVEKIKKGIEKIDVSRLIEKVEKGADEVLGVKLKVIEIKSKSKNENA